MKCFRLFSGVFLPSLLALLCLGSCDFFPVSDPTGTIRISFPEPVVSATRTSASPLDTNEFELTVLDAGGSIIYKGSYGAAPAEFPVRPGSYTLSVISAAFDAPCFDAPQYGDTQVVVVSAGKTSMIQFSCYQMNSGIRLDIDDSFIDEYPGGTLTFHALSGSLSYGYNEKRIGYFQPGNVSLLLRFNGSEQTLLTRRIEAQQVLTLHLSASMSSTASESSGHMSILVDTTRVWIDEQYKVGDDSKGASPESAFSVSEAREHTGAQNVWVCGYIVGGDLSSSNCRFTPPFSSRTNLAIAAKSSCRDKGACLSVQLAKGDIRDELNLVDHENHLGRQIFLRGDIVEAYYGIPGLQNIKEYRFK